MTKTSFCTTFMLVQDTTWSLCCRATTGHMTTARRPSKIVPSSFSMTPGDRTNKQTTEICKIWSYQFSTSYFQIADLSLSISSELQIAGLRLSIFYFFISDRRSEPITNLYPPFRSPFLHFSFRSLPMTLRLPSVSICLRSSLHPRLPWM